MTADDASSLARWEWIETIGWLAVIVGCFGEGIAEFTKWPKDDEKRHKLGKVSWLILIAGLALEFWGSGRVATIKDLEVARLNKEAGDARRIAGEANKQAGLANERASSNELAAIQFAKDVAKSVLPRSLGLDDFIISRLAAFTNITAEIKVERSEDGPALASDIAENLRGAGWKLTNTGFNDGPLFPGVQVSFNNWELAPESRLTAARDALVAELLAHDIDATSPFTASKYPRGVILISVGRKKSPLEDKRFLESRAKFMERAIQEVEKHDLTTAAQMRTNELRMQKHLKRGF